MEILMYLTVKLLSSLLLFSYVTSCLPKHQSDFKEAPGEGDDPRLIGGSANTSWDVLQKDTGAEIRVPWTDTYWPLMRMSLANRWMLKETKGSITQAPAIPSVQLTEMISAFSAGNTKALAELSPGEKYDLIKNSGEVSQGLLDSLKSEATSFDLPNLLALKNDVDRLQANQSRIVNDYSALEKLISKLANDLQNHVRKWRTAIREAAGGNAQAKASEAKARAEFEQIRAKLAQAQNRLKTIIGMEYLQVIRDSQNARSALKAAILPKLSIFQVSAQKISRESLLLGDGWLNWANFVGEFEDDNWGWMGHCHGWAPASLYEDSPKHAVMVNIKGRDILLTEGDVRGLLTKVWADQLPEDKFSGNRCNAENLEFDKWGRVVDGAICDGNRSSCSLKAGGKQMVISSSKLDQGLVIFSDSPESAESHVGLVNSNVENNIYSQ